MDREERERGVITSIVHRSCPYMFGGMKREKKKGKE